MESVRALALGGHSMSVTLLRKVASPLAKDNQHAPKNFRPKFTVCYRISKCQRMYMFLDGMLCVDCKAHFQPFTCGSRYAKIMPVSCTGSLRIARPAGKCRKRTLVCNSLLKSAPAWECLWTSALTAYFSSNARYTNRKIRHLPCSLEHHIRVVFDKALGRISSLQSVSSFRIESAFSTLAKAHPFLANLDWQSGYGTNSIDILVVEGVTEQCLGT